MSSIEKFLTPFLTPFQEIGFRLFLGSALLLLAWDRHKDVAVFFGSDDRSLLLPEVWESAWVTSQIPPFPFFLSSDWAERLHAVLVVLLVAFLLGMGGRTLSLSCWLLNAYFLLRNPLAWHGGDMIGNIWLFYSIFFNPFPWGLEILKRLIKTSFLIPTGSRFHFLFQRRLHRGSQDTKIENFGKTGGGDITLHGNQTFSLIIDTITFWRRNSWPDRLISGLGARMIMGHLFIIYFFTGMEKLRGQTWWEGTALWYVLSNSQMVTMDVTEWLRFFPWFVPIITHLTVFFEIAFPFGVGWGSRVVRNMFLFFGLLFHVGIGVLIALWPFGLVMLAPYFLFFSISNPKN